ncbi:TonB-dependent receptor plug domain-containing protein [Thiorhodococcus fuscus]|uniref:TonB-dependent receptor plug domain-containing protein n=1 Tax=Thiorhodococcus fuscus TaxID=527200 RepID=A0ABW4YDS3_9GAMM
MTLELFRTRPEAPGSRLLRSFVCLFCLGALPAQGDDLLVSDRLQRLKGMKIQELLDVSVTSVSRRPQKYADAAAALFVISSEDIRRSGATCIPELLRMVPGIEVAQIDANKWAISSRGFNGRYASKLLVQLDGRTLYTPLYSGVYWDAQDTLLDDIERIEVIRGPGATLWGANAVNGIINIITRSAHDTEGGLLNLAVGNEEHASGAIRYGLPLGDGKAVRVYAKGFDRDGSITRSGEEGADDWRGGQLGFRADLDLSSEDTLTLQGDYYNGDAGANLASGSGPTSAEADISGGNLLGRWSRQQGMDSTLALQIYYDQTRRANWTLTEIRDTLDIDLKQDLNLAGRHLLVWGLGYRMTRDDLSTDYGSALRFDPSRRQDTILSGFIQDDLSLANGRLHLIVGTKLEHNDYTQWELQPNIRVLWNMAADTNLWAAVSRAVRTSSRFESDSAIMTGPVVISGNPEMTSERLTAYEVGLRARPRENLSIDLTAFVNQYDHLQTYKMAGRGFVLTYDNGGDGIGYGVELASNWDLTRAWRLKLAYSWLQMELDSDDSASIASIDIYDSAPHHQLSLRSWVDLGPNLEFDTNLYFVDGLEHYDTDAYLRVDVRLGWRLAPDMELSLVGRNLGDDRHGELSNFHGGSGSSGLIYTQVERSLLLQAKWFF